MKADWLLIAALAGLTTSVAALGVGAATLMRSGPEVARKAPPSPVLLSSRRIDVVAPADLQIFSQSPASAVLAAATPASAPAPVRERPSSGYELFPTSTNADAPVTAVKPASPRIAPIVAKPAPAPAAKPASVYALATKNPAPPPQSKAAPVSAPPSVVERRYEGVFTPAEIGRLKASLRLTPDQEPLWRPLEAELRKVGKLQMASVDSGGKADIPRSSYQSLYQAGNPLLQSLRPDQKERVRVLARRMGYGSVASLI